MRVLLIQMDGSLPNIALMRIASHHRALGDDVSLRYSYGRDLWEQEPDRVYASLIFERTRPRAEALLRARPDAIVGGTGWDIGLTLEAGGIATKAQDYSLYPDFVDSIGFTQRGCRLRCEFCVVPRKEGRVVEEQSIADLWRGDPYPRHLLILDNDFFGQPRWPERIEEIRAGKFKVAFSQGINARMLTDEAAGAIASIDYRDDGFKDRRIYTAWDNKDDEAVLFRGLERLVRAGVEPDAIMVFMLVGFWPGETQADRLYRHDRLREFGARPYPMPYVRTPELRGFQTWCVGAYDKRVAWADWERAGYSPRRLGLKDARQRELFA